MARLRLNKTTKIILAISIVLLSTALGYLVWRVNQPAGLAPIDSDAFSCPDGCYPNTALEICTGKGGCIAKPTGGCPSGLEEKSGFCCDPCKSSGVAPAECKFYSTPFTPPQPYTGGGVDCGGSKGACPAGYYKCDSNGYCIPCTKEQSGETIYKSITECQYLADKSNGQYVGSCPPGGYKWACKQMDDGSGYKLVQTSCTEEEPPQVDCGKEPTSAQLQSAGVTVNKLPTTIGPFPEDGKVVLYFKSLLDSTYNPKLTFKDKAGKTYEYTMSGLSDNRKRVVTDIAVKAGDTITFTGSNDNNNQGSPECAPTSNNPKYMSFAWTPPKSGQCGSGLMGPPSQGGATPMPKVSISSDITWAKSFGYEIVGNGTQCWSDWREWPGDYDFNDYFLQVSYLVEEPPATPNLTVNKSVVESCTDEDTSNPTAELAYTIAVTNTGGADGEFSKIEDVLDSKVEDSFVEVSSITGGGTYADGKIVWDGNTTVKAGESISYTYTLVVDKDSFDTYSNTVTLTTGSETKTDKATITADCVITEEPEEPEEPEVPTEGEVPQTGIFDSTAGRILAGVSLVVIGALVYISPNISLSTLNGHIKSRRVYIKERNISKLRKRFEKKVEKR